MLKILVRKLNVNLSPDVAVPMGWNYLLQKGRLNGWVGYTLAKLSWFSEIENGRVFPATATGHMICV